MLTSTAKISSMRNQPNLVGISSYCCVVPASRTGRVGVLARSAHVDQADAKASRPIHAAMALLAASQMLLAPVSGPALAALDTTSKPASDAGAGAKVEGSNLFDQSGLDALQQLTDVALPDAEAALEKLDTAEAKNALLELNGLTSAVSELNERAEKGLKDPQLKSAVSGIEQQLNAAKAIAGLD